MSEEAEEEYEDEDWEEEADKSELDDGLGQSQASIAKDSLNNSALSQSGSQADVPPKTTGGSANAPQLDPPRDSEEGEEYDEEEAEEAAGAEVPVPATSSSAPVESSSPPPAADSETSKPALSPDITSTAPDAQVGPPAPRGPGPASVSVSYRPAAGFPDVAFEPVLLTEGVQLWTKLPHQVSRLPGHLEGGTLLRGTKGALVSMRSLSVTSTECDARLYVVTETTPPGPISPSSHRATLAESLATGPCWLAESTTPVWEGHEGPEPSTVMFSIFVPQGLPVTLPEVAGATCAAFMVLVPVAAGSFAVAATSNTNTYTQTTVVKEGVMPWTDRNHRFSGIPDYLLGGILFMGPQKDVPEGTVLTVRPSAAATVYVVVERMSGGGLCETLPAKGWSLENGAPRWHDMPTMVTYSKAVCGGWPATLPATKGNVAKFSIIVVPEQRVPVAPLEVSAGAGGTAAVLDLEILPLTEGVVLKREGEEGTLTSVPEWMLGASLVRSRGSSLGSGASFGLRAAAASVFYVVVEAAEASPAAAADIEALTSAGWESRPEAPTLSSSTGGKGRALAVFARRALPEELLTVPELSAPGNPVVLVSKVDIEAFDAVVESSGPHFTRAQIVETALGWSNCLNRLTWLPSFWTGGRLLKGPLEIPPGTELRVRANRACRVYVALEVEYRGAKASRDGNLPELLVQKGWAAENAAPNWGDTASVLRVYSKRCTEGELLVLPQVLAPLLACFVAVSLSATGERVGEELRRLFREWDPEGLGGLRPQDLAALLVLLCPGLSAEARELVVERALAATSKGRAAAQVIGHQQFIEQLMVLDGA